MPFKSKKQEGWFFEHKPEIAKQWAKETPNIKGLPTYKNKGLAQDLGKKNGKY